MSVAAAFAQYKETQNVEKNNNTRITPTNAMFILQNMPI
jgi:hypothetical protein